MNIEIVRGMANELMDKHGLIGNGWRFEFDRAKKRFGCCFYNKKVISLSEYYVENNEERLVRDTILHEIAHGLVGFNAGHGYLWKLKAIEVGAIPKACKSTSEVNIEAGLYQSECSGCHKIYHLHRRPSRVLICNSCHKLGLVSFANNNHLIWRNMRTGELIDNKNKNLQYA